MKNKHRQERKKRSRKEDSDSSDDERPVKPQQKKQKPNDGPSVNRRMANTKEVIRTRDFKLKLWTGPPGEEVPSEETKQLRKSIGVNVRGECKDAPAPVLSLESEYLPEMFKNYCQQHHIVNLTSIQKQSWPSILNGANIIGISPTGSGKTLAFALPAIHHILSAPSSSFQSNKASPYVLVLAPARELAIQIHSVFKSCRQVKSALLYGGQEKQAQIDSLRSMGKQCKVLVATPGRLLDILHDEDCPLDLNQVSYQVIDEADRMLAMGFLEQLQDVSTYMHPARQILLFSATFPGKLREVCSLWIPQHVMIRVNTIDMNDGNAAKTEATTDNTTTVAPKAAASTESSKEVVPEKPVAKKAPAVATVAASAPTSSNDETAEADQASASVPAPLKPTSLPASALTVSPTIQQVIHVCAAHKKPRLLIKFVERIRAKEKEEKRRQADPMIVFCNKIKTLGFLNTFLKKQNIPFVMLHGNIPQSQREENLNNFRSVSFVCWSVLYFLFDRAFLTFCCGIGKS